MVAHPVLLRGASLAGSGSERQLILERTDREFIPAILDELARPGGTADLLRTRVVPRNADGVLKLFQPVQRTFNVVLFEAACGVPGTPRLDPARIESAGLVMRRVRRDAQNVPHYDDLDGWYQDGRTLKGWIPFGTRDSMDFDPDVTRRPAPTAGHRDIDRRLALWRGLTQRLSETVTPLFVAPPEVCRSLGKTILFGVIPVASSEISEVPLPGLFGSDEVANHISPYFKTAPTPTVVVPRPKDQVGTADADDPRLEPWVNMLRQLVVEFDAFGKSPPSLQLFDALQAIRVPVGNALWRQGYRAEDLLYSRSYDHLWEKRPAGELLRAHADVLVLGASQKVHMPAGWPVVTERAATDIAVAAKNAIEARLAALIRPRQPRFDQRTRPRVQHQALGVGRSAPPSDDGGEIYRLRAFVRVRPHERGHEHCPPRTVWSEHSDPFTIAPWYEGTGAPPVQVALPDPTDRDFLKQLRPNVAFAVPGALFKMLQQNDPKKLIKGEGSSSGGPSQPDWICGFNIPIITICAFILLSIILSLLNIIFWWLPFVKICIPIPRSMRP
jgi:hypothetical protein